VWAKIKSSSSFSKNAMIRRRTGRYHWAITSGM
jgi:hypothetical protein